MLFLNTFVITSNPLYLLPLSAFPIAIICFLPCVRTTMAQIRSFASIGLSLWNRLPPPPLRSSILSSSPLLVSISLALSELDTITIIVLFCLCLLKSGFCAAALPVGPGRRRHSIADLLRHHDDRFDDPPDLHRLSP